VCAATGSIFAGLAYPMIVALVTFVVGARYLPETRDVRIWDEFEVARAGEEPRGGHAAPAAVPMAPAVVGEPAPETT
jgi:hypothetical protein